MSTNTEAIIAKVQALLANADDEGNSDEARDAYRAKADALMFKYRIEQAMLADKEREVGSSTRVGKQRMWICRSNNQYRNQMYHLAYYAANHAGCEEFVGYERNPNDNDRQWLYIDIYGYESDLQYAQMLFASARGTFSARLEPKVDPSLSDEENVWRLRNAGVERPRIAILMGWMTQAEFNSTLSGKDWWRASAARSELQEQGISLDEAKKRVARATMRVTPMVKRYAKKHNIDAEAVLGRGNSMEAYRVNFAQAFVTTIAHRLRRLRQARGEGTHALVLKRSREDILERMYQDHPGLRPSDNPVAQQEECQRCKAAKSGHCRQHRPYRGRTRTYQYNEEAQERGQDAAMRVDLTGGSHPTAKAPRGSDPSAITGKRN